MAKRKECKFCGKKGVESGECGLCRKEANQTYVEYWKRMPLNISARISRMNKWLLLILLALVVRVTPYYIVTCDNNLQRTIYPIESVLNARSIKVGEFGTMKQIKNGFVFVRNYEKADN